MNRSSACPGDGAVIASKLLALMFSLVILGNALLVRRLLGTWFAPSAMFALFWFGFTFVPLIALFTVAVNPWALAYICAGTLAFSASAFVFFDWDRAMARNAAKPPPETYFNTPFLRTVFAAAALISIPCFFLNMAVQGFSVSDLFSRMFETASTYALMRYTESLTPNIYSGIGIVMAYVAVMTGGLLFGSSRSRRQSILTLLGAFLPALAQLLFESAKGLLFFFMVLFFAGVLVTRIFRGQFHLLDRSTLRKSAIGVAVLAPLIIVSFLSRGLYAVEDPELLRTSMTQYAVTYAFGHLYAFSDWFSFRMGLTASQPYNADPTGYGFYTFMSLFHLAGSTRTVPLGIYEEIYTYADLISTNIYTLYRGLIIDFGMAGGLVFSFASGLAMNLSYYVLLHARKPVLSVVGFILTVGYCYMSFALSMWTWNIIPVVAVGLAIFLYANRVIQASGIRALPQLRET